MTIRPLGQSGYQLKTEKSEIIIDPYLSDSVNRVAGRPRLLPLPISPAEISCDAVICTHDHLDHLDPDTVTEISPMQLFITTNEGKEKLKSLGKENVIAINEGECISLGDFEITAVFADHTVEAFGLIVRVEGKTLYFSGDTLYNEKLFDIAKHRPDITFICINGRLGNMNASEALTVAKRIGAKINIPNHYDMFASNSEDPHLFADNIDGGMIMDFDKEYII
jgi:L-ascorbate metabolism protein UlaG (beta-lactamase superfamily)